MEIIFEKNKSYLGDCLELMPQMESGMFDMILCDLPYGTTACKWDTIIPFDKLWVQYERLIKPNGVIVLTASQPFTSALVMSNPKLFKYEWVWHKNTISGFVLAKKQPLRNHENILIFYKKQPTYNPIFEKYGQGTINRFKNNGKVNSNKMQARGYTNEIHGIKRVNDEIQLKRGSYPKSVQKINSVPNCNGRKLHPTQKPVSLFEYLIRTYTNENDLILDNCAGSGTTGEACFNTGRNYIQIEKEQKYFDLILAREKSFNKKELQQKFQYEDEK